MPGTPIRTAPPRSPAPRFALSDGRVVQDGVVTKASVDVGPTLNAALVELVAPSEQITGKASGALLGLDNDLFLLTNWHVATGRRWMSQAERVEWKELHGDEVAWASSTACYAPRALRVSIYVMGEQHVLTQVELAVAAPTNDADPRYAWDSDDEIVPEGLAIPIRDVVCLHLGDGLASLNGRLAIAKQGRARLGYDYWETGLDHGPAVGDRAFVIGFPRDIGTRKTDPPVWTGATIATNPEADWEGARFLIDARTREGQSGSAVVAHSPAAGGLPSRTQLLGLYSGRIDEKADIGSAWRLDDVLEDIVTMKRRPRTATPSEYYDGERLLPPGI